MPRKGVLPRQRHFAAATAFKEKSMEENSPKLHVNGEISSGSFDLRSFPVYGIRAALRTTGVRHLPNLDMLPTDSTASVGWFSVSHRLDS
jgi:hypothetical protein